MQLENQAASRVAHNRPTERRANRGQSGTIRVKQGQDGFSRDIVASCVRDSDNTAANEGLDVDPGGGRHVLTGPDFRKTNLISDQVLVVGRGKINKGVEAEDVI